MLRARISLPKQQSVHYHYLDVLHDALVNAWTAAGAAGTEVTGMNARPWTFAALGHRTAKDSLAHSLVVSTPDTTLAQWLYQLKPKDIHYARFNTLERVSFAEAEITYEPDPILPQQNALGALLLSPLAIKEKNNSKRWHKNLAEVELSQAISQRLSRIAEREIQLQVQADSLYLRCNPEHSVLVPIKKMSNGKLAYIIGMSAPLVLMGSEADLRLAWYAGLGEKTRSGFGCIGLAEQGVGR
ncbi:MAG: CRISPR-associated endoribonuclease Cas6 [Pseudomonadota bacterium]|nr:CRISPR-associated endoribonuclease Cas6 [Pseudomonadota bacterium]